MHVLFLFFVFCGGGGGRGKEKGWGEGGAEEVHFICSITLKEWYKISSDTHWLKFCNRTSEII